MRTVYSKRHQLHTTDDIELEGEPFVTEEVPARVEIILEALQAAAFGQVQAPADHGMAPILAVHDAEYVGFLQTAYAEQAAFFGQGGPVFAWSFAPRGAARKPRSFLGLKGYYAFSWGTPILKGTWEAAYWSAQCALTAADLLERGEPVVYALCRPPGHHAAADLYGGFCYLNNAAIAARYLGRDGARIAILDIDYHHGNGTQAIFYDDPAVLFCSLHADPDWDYPYFWGGADERGAGLGEGFNLNWPLPLETDDAAYLVALDAALAAIQAYHPDRLVVSVGFDTVRGDEVGSFDLTADGLSQVGRRVADLGLPALLVQEGGYLLERLADNALAFLQPFSARD